ncbi:HAD-IIIA family hydrolase [Streptomyces sp. AC627_RSS907]|uniref:D-glycero-alpha-D-manno-heptose-1,7-bisphosphate 7-phosphatase n=1 Tax=Streptomyces sp. AC627_RSS907 TaxID=2823684 RepID=UPI0035B13722
MSPVKAVLFDRDGTLVHDVPYNGDPARVRPVDGAREAVAMLREHGIRVGVVTNQSGVARGLISDADVRRVNRRIDDLVGPFDVWAVCPHGPDDGCHCRKPLPGLVLWAAGRVCTDPADCVVIGDIGADTEAAERAGAHGILVPNARTRPEETAAAARVAPDLLTAVRMLLDDPPDDRAPADAHRAGTAYGPGRHEPGRPGATDVRGRGRTARGPGASGPAADGDGSAADGDRPAADEDGSAAGGDRPAADGDGSAVGPGPGRPPAPDARDAGRSAAGTGPAAPVPGAARTPSVADSRGRPR